MSPVSNISSIEHLSWQPSPIPLMMFLLAVPACHEAEMLTANKYFISNLWSRQKCQHLAKLKKKNLRSETNKHSTYCVHGCCRWQLPLHLGRGGPADPQVHWCQRAGAEGRVGARKQDYNELFRQEMALHETKYLSVYIQISTALPI